jgi:hypothetical protein
MINILSCLKIGFYAICAILFPFILKEYYSFVPLIELWPFTKLFLMPISSVNYYFVVLLYSTILISYHQLFDS